MGAETQPQIKSSGHRRFILALFISSLVFALGVSITIWGVSTPYLATNTDQIIVVLIGLAMLIGGLVGSYMTLN